MIVQPIKSLLSLIILMAVAAPLVAQDGEVDKRVPDLDGVQILTGGAERLTIASSYWAVTNKDVGRFDEPRFITNAARFSNAWKQLGFSSRLPSVDFNKSFIATYSRDANDPNKVSLAILRNEDGIARISAWRTLVGYPRSDDTFVVFFEVSREGVKGFRNPALSLD